ncbi:MAG: nucleotidyltransferase domain-containing protein [Clostridia bacterium]|nr:nucleotidyltransferase domain-containing protein [Clostridia bacterium]
MRDDPRTREILDALIRRWQPAAVLVYGSFADGTWDDQSDFDALVLTRTPAPAHDTSLLCGRRLDVFFSSPEIFEGEWFPEDFVQLYHAVPAYDPEGRGQAVIGAVRRWADSRPPRSRADRLDSLAWLDKMLERAGRGDPEGDYRLLWLLTDSLEIWCDVTGRFCFGPKKSLALLREKDPAGWALYTAALRSPRAETAEPWVAHLRRLNNEKPEA